MINTNRAGLGLAVGADAPAKTPMPAFAQTDLMALSRYFLLLLMRNVTSSGYVIEDPASPGVFSKPGCVIAAPSYPANTPGVDQDYVFNWVRDSAITAIEIASADLPPVKGGGVPALVDYVNFAALCQTNAKNSSAVTLGHACFTVAGDIRPWSEQNDGPAIQSIALLIAFDQLDGNTQSLAKQLIETIFHISCRPIRTRLPTCGRSMSDTRSLREPCNCGFSRKFQGTPSALLCLARWLMRWHGCKVSLPPTGTGNSM